ncbi:MAG: biotin/lipoyl-binding protein [Clostridia bacterium]|nr:biotin/lipoyl-binding protein [Clostridia bacterium]
MRNFIVTIDGKKYTVGVEEIEGTSADASEKAEVFAPAKAEEPKAASVAPKAPVSGEKVVSPFPGLIKNLLVENGTAVKKDQAIMVLEAMKMDNDITAPCDGVVTFAVAKGANVETNVLLATIS